MYVGIYFTQPIRSTPFYWPTQRLSSKHRTAIDAGPEFQPELLRCEFQLACPLVNWSFAGRILVLDEKGGLLEFYIFLYDKYGTYLIAFTIESPI